MLRYLIIAFLSFILSACVTTPEPAKYRIGKITIDTNGVEYGTKIAHDLRWKIRHFSKQYEGNSTINAPTRDIHISLRKVRFAKIHGIFKPGRSSLEFNVSYAENPSLLLRVRDTTESTFKPRRFYGFDATFKRLTDKAAAGLVHYFHTGKRLHGDHRTVATPDEHSSSHNPVQYQQGSQGNSSVPPSVLIGG